MSSNDDALVKAWASAYTSEVLAFARPEEVSNEEVFADVYHSLIHSAGLSATLLQLVWVCQSSLSDFKSDKIQSNPI